MKIPKILFYLGVGAYIAASTYKTIQVNKKIEPLRKEFVKAVETLPYKIEKEGDIIRYNYGGKLDEIIKERNQKLDTLCKDCIWIVTWQVYDYPPKALPRPVLCFYFPFKKF
ncbi:MAG: hypothetical protein QXQ82_02960 [Candidatus Pacearchaeota archaeon]